jgi:hypothetical protein
MLEDYSPATAIKRQLELLQAKIREESQKGVVKKVSWLQQSLGKGLLIGLAACSLSPLLPVVFAGVPASIISSGAIGFANGLLANVVASWIDDVTRVWANIPDQGEQRFNYLCAELTVQLRQNEELLKGIIYFLHNTDACHVAIKALEQHHEQSHQELDQLKQSLQELQKKINFLIHQQDSGKDSYSIIEHLRKWIFPQQIKHQKDFSRQEDIEPIISRDNITETVSRDLTSHANHILTHENTNTSAKQAAKD